MSYTSADELTKMWAKEAQKLSENGVSLGNLINYARGKHEKHKSQFPKRLGDKASKLTSQAEALLSNYELEELFFLTLGFQQIATVFAASSSSVVKQALARNCDIEISTDPVESFEQYRGPKLATTPHESVVIITNGDNVSKIPVHKAAMNVNMAKIEKGDKAVAMDQPMSEFFYMFTHLYTWTGIRFEMKSAWTAEERARFGFEKVMRGNYMMLLQTMAREIASVAKKSKYAKEFEGQTLAGPKLAELLEIVYALTDIPPETFHSRNQLLVWFADLFVPSYNKDKKVVNAVYPRKYKKEKEGSDPIVSMTFEMPIAQRVQMLPTMVAKTVFAYDKDAATYNQFSSELKEARAKCGTNVNTETTPGTREMLLGVKTGTTLIDIINLMADLGKVDWKKHSHVILELKHMAKATQVLRAFGSIISSEFHVYIPDKFIEKHLCKRDESGLFLVANPNIRFHDHKDYFTLTRMFKGVEFVSLDLTGKGDDVVGKMEEAVKIGESAIKDMVLRGVPAMKRLTYYPGLFGDQRVVAFSGAGLHNMVVWVTFGITVGDLGDRYSSQQVEEGAYYKAGVCINILRQVAPFFQRDMKGQLARFKVKVPKLVTKVVGVRTAVVNDMISVIDDQDYTRYTNVVFMAMAINSQAAKSVAAPIAMMEDEGEKNQSTGNNSKESEAANDDEAIAEQLSNLAALLGEED